MAKDAFYIDRGNLRRMERTWLTEIGFKERRDLQRWVTEHPQIVGPDLLFVTAEMDRWQRGSRRVDDRLDLLFLDSSGCLIVVELKVGKAPEHVLTQAINYAALCSNLTVEDLVAEYARQRGIGPDQARDEVQDHAESLATDGIGAVKLHLLAEDFRSVSTNAVLFLRDTHGMDVSCTEIAAFVPEGALSATVEAPEGSPNEGSSGDEPSGEGYAGMAVVTHSRLIPLPAAEDYMVRRRRQEKEEERREALTRKPNAVPILIALGAVGTGEKFELNLDAFSEADKPLIEGLLRSTPDAGVASWTNENTNQALRWRLDGQCYSASGIVKSILRRAGAREEGEKISVHSSLYWRGEDGLTIWEKYLAAEEDGGGSGFGSPNGSSADAE